MPLEDLEQVTSLQAPHRVADALLRDSVDEAGTPVLSHDAGHERDNLIVDAEIAMGRPGPAGL